MFQRSPGYRLSSGSAPRVRAKGHAAQAARPKVRALLSGARKACGWCCPPESGLRQTRACLATRRWSCRNAARKRPLTGTRPCQTATKTRCCAGRRSGSKQHDAIAIPIRPWQRRATYKRSLQISIPAHSSASRLPAFAGSALRSTLCRALASAGLSALTWP